MRFLRSAQFAAIVLLIAATLGILAANSPLGSAIATARQAHLPAFGLDLTTEHWITDGLLAIFFFLASVELKH